MVIKPIKIKMLDVTGISYFNPIFTFTLLFVIVYAILSKTKILGDSSWIQVIVSLVLSAIFVSVVEIRGYVESVVPGFSVLVVLMFFVLFLAAFALGKADSIAKPWLIWVFIIILGLVFLYQGYYHLHMSSNHTYLGIRDFLGNSRVSGGLWLVIFAAIVTFAITRKAGGK